MVIPSDYEVHDKTEYPSIPDGYYVISKAYYDQLQETVIQCKEILIWKQ